MKIQSSNAALSGGAYQYVLASADLPSDLPLPKMVDRDCMIHVLREQAREAGFRLLTYVFCGRHVRILVAMQSAAIWIHTPMPIRHPRCSIRPQVMRRVGRIICTRRGGADGVARSWTLRRMRLFVAKVGTEYASWISQQPGWRAKERKVKCFEEAVRFEIVCRRTDLMRRAIDVDMQPMLLGEGRHPGDYLWSGYGGALGDQVEALESLVELMCHARGPTWLVNAGYRGIREERVLVDYGRELEMAWAIETGRDESTFVPRSPLSPSPNFKRSGEGHPCGDGTMITGPLAAGLQCYDF